MGSLVMGSVGEVFLYFDSYIGVIRRSWKRQVAKLTKRCNGGASFIIAQDICSYKIKESIGLRREDEHKIKASQAIDRLRHQRLGFCVIAPQTIKASSSSRECGLKRGAQGEGEK